MADDKALDAMRRIDAALARIEAEIDQPPPAGGLGAAYAILEDQHERMRDGIRQIIIGLDAMIGEDADASGAEGVAG
ncbi:hypothetical protein PQ455_06230 [Sphingomonas naphthae]|uniref:Uncharacterized protein n=1 Tax=Sphingomonas naphthae TaxID=1813468 RepID=A0ABY7TSG7_9SPHN|nr:hypothetical protein [Sphingomonas naphthae]WCT74814.1 hypothetical protein PQ455_06230 [Sphingomonas naphthae]